MSIQILRDEITNDPLTRGYSGMTDQQVVDSLNNKNRDIDVGSLTTWDLLNAIEPNEYGALTAAKQSELQMVISAVYINPLTNNYKPWMRDIFANGTASRSGLLALADPKRKQSRAEEIGFGRVVELIDVKKARGTN